MSFIEHAYGADQDQRRRRPVADARRERGERPPDAVTTEAEYDQFFRQFDQRLEQIWGDIPEGIEAIGTRAQRADLEAFADEKAGRLRSFADRVIDIGIATEDAFPSFESGLAPDTRTKIDQHLSPVFLMESLGNAYQYGARGSMHRLIDPESSQETIEAVGRQIKFVDRRLKGAIFEGSLRALALYFEDLRAQNEEQQGKDPRFLKGHVQMLVQRVTQIALESEPIDVGHCLGLLEMVTANESALREIEPSWFKKSLYGVVERVTGASYAEFWTKMVEATKEETDDAVRAPERVTECAQLFVPLVGREIAAARTLEATIPWHVLDLKLSQDRPEDMPPPRYLRSLQLTAKDHTGRLLEGIGLPADLMEAWTISEKPERLSNYMLKNARLIDKLEQEVPGAAKTLCTEFGIRNFARHSFELWLGQYQERHSLKPYGILLTPASDWNGAISDGRLGRLTDQASEEIREAGVLLRVVECRNKIDLARKLLELKRRYQLPPGGHAISFQLVAGHGSKDSIQIGHTVSPPRGQTTRSPAASAFNIAIINHDDVVAPGLSRLKSLFRPDAPMVLLSCSTGTAGGIGETMSRVYAADLTAPTVPSHVKKWLFHATPDGKVTITTEFIPDEEGYPGVEPTARYVGSAP